MFRSRHRVLVLVLVTIIAVVSSGRSSLLASQPASHTFAGAAPTVAFSAVAVQLTGTTTTETVDVNGVPRKALVYVPAQLAAGKVPAILLLHGRGMSATIVASLFGLQAEADRLGFVAVFPNGSAYSGGICCAWNGRDDSPLWGMQGRPDDVAFISGLMDLLIAKYAVDPDRISVAGFSNGSVMTGRLACELSDRIAAVAMDADARDDSACDLQRPLSILAIHGTANVEPYQGGLGSLGLLEPSEAEVSAFWSTYDGCGAGPAVSAVSSTVELQSYTQCQEGTEVRLYTVQGGAHCWPGGDVDLSSQCGVPLGGFNATPVVVQFLLAHPRLGAPAP
jgi:polyhydroxybutyrate depolymerase